LTEYFLVFLNDYSRLILDRLPPILFLELAVILIAMGFARSRFARRQEVIAGVIFRHDYLFLPDRSPDFWLVTRLYLV
jgi:hypothetical protein